MEKGNGIHGRNRALEAIRKEIGRIAAKPINILIRGERGTGRRLVARAFERDHDLQKRPFVIVDCTVPEPLLETTLFGDQPFPGANIHRVGAFEAAAGGTILLDEVGDMPLHIQARVRSLLEDQSVRGAGWRERLHVRIIAITDADLASAIAARKFRLDLYYRLNEALVRLPSSRGGKPSRGPTRGKGPPPIKPMRRAA